MKKSHLILLGLMVFYIVVRMLVVSSNREQIFDYNEFFSGTLAMELIQGLSLPLKRCMPDDHNFGSIVNGILIVPFYQVFGPSLASSKMVSILFSAGVLIFSYLLLNRFFNRNTAVIAGLLFIFSPTIYTKSSVLSVGSHPETNLFTLMILFILYLIFFDNRKNTIYFIILGLIAGFGLFYSYICGIVLLVFLLCWFTFDRKFVLKPQFYFFSLFFIIGFSPRFYFAGGIGSAVEGVSAFLQQAISLQEIISLRSILKAKAFLLKDIPRILNFEHLPRVIQYVYYSFFLLSLSYILRCSIRNKSKIMAKESPFLILFSIFTLAYVLGRYATWGGWACAGYIVPLYPIIFIIVAISIDKFMQARNRFLKIPTVIFLIFILLSGLYENIALISFRHIGQGFSWKGYSYRFFGERVGSYDNFGNIQFLEVIRKMNFSKKQHFLAGLGWHIARSGMLRRENDVTAEDAIKLCHFSAQERLYYYKGFGRGLAHEMDYYLLHKKDLNLPYNPEFDLGIIKRIIGGREPNLQQYFWEGFGEEINLRSDAYKMIKDYINEESRPFFYRGIGETMAWTVSDENSDLDAVFIDVEPKYKEFASEGYQKMYSEMSLVKLRD